MLLTNNQIYQFYKNIYMLDGDLKLPIKISFKIQKNKNTLQPLAEEIEKALMTLYSQYGEYNDNGKILIHQEYIEKCNREIEELMNITQEVYILKIQLSELEDSLYVSNDTMKALMFMIQEEKED